MSQQQPQIKVTRQVFTNTTSIGEMTIAGVHECYTLEDKDRHLETNPDAKVATLTAIPRGVYQLELRMSPHFGRITPHLLNVPNYENVLIHWGNYAKDTDGCILVGKTKDVDFIGQSKDEFEHLMSILTPMIEGGDCWIEVA